MLTEWGDDILAANNLLSPSQPIIKHRNRMSDSFLSLQASYPTYQLVLATVATTYAAIFVTTSNHFVFRPKIESLFQHSSISSSSLYQFLVDFLSNMTTLTFILCSLFIFKEDNALSVMVYTDMSWSSLMLGIVAFKVIQSKEEPNLGLMLTKNITFLGLIYLLITFHYATSNYFISLGLLMIFIYMLNLLLNANQDKFVAGMEFLFGYKPTDEVEEEYNHSSNVPSPEALHHAFPIDKSEIEEEISKKYLKLKNIKLKTKRLMVENLLKISLAVYLSKEKLEQKSKRDIKYYYGTFNGTVIQKSKKMILEKAQTPEESRSSEELNPQHHPENDQAVNSALFYIFPVRIFENSKALSVLFSIAINLGMGVLLSVVLNMTLTVHYGQYFQLFFGLLLLPVIPSVSKEQFVHNMALSSLWKYCLYGIFLSLVCLFSDKMPEFSFAVNKQLIFSPLIQLVALVVSTIFLFKRNPSPYSFLFIWGSTILLTSVMIFKHI